MWSDWPEDEFFDEFPKDTCKHDECDEDGVCLECGAYIPERDRSN